MTDAPRKCDRECGTGPAFKGERVSKGRRRARYCSECGGLIDGGPGIIPTLFRWWTGRWPHQEAEA